MFKLTCGVIAVALLSACGYTEEEMAAKQREINVLTSEVHALRTASMPPVYGYGPANAVTGQARRSDSAKRVAAKPAP